MVGANKNQSIHELLTNMQHLDKHKPYGGLSMIFGGDLKQLGKPEKKRVPFKQFIFRASSRSFHFQTSKYTWKIKSSRKHMESVRKLPSNAKSEVSWG